MSTQEQNTPTLSDNELIARFMKLDRHPNNQRAYWIEDQDCYLTFDNLQFHHSWNQLMPVVEKINRMDKMVTINYYTDAHVTVTKIYSWNLGDNVHEDEFEEEKAIDSVYKAVVNFIKWHNSESKHP